jgi:hypothetical protein
MTAMPELAIILLGLVMALGGLYWSLRRTIHWLTASWKLTEMDKVLAVCGWLIFIIGAFMFFWYLTN